MNNFLWEAGIEIFWVGFHQPLCNITQLVTILPRAFLKGNWISQKLYHMLPASSEVLLINDPSLEEQCDPKILPPWKKNLQNCHHFVWASYCIISFFKYLLCMEAHFWDHFLSSASPQSPQKHLLNWIIHWPYLCSAPLCLSVESFPCWQTRTPVRCNFLRYLTLIKYSLPLVLWLFYPGFPYIALKHFLFFSYPQLSAFEALE